MIRRPPRSTPSNSSAASDVYKRQGMDPKKLDFLLETFTVEVIEGRNLKKGDDDKVVLGYNYQFKNKIFKRAVSLRDKLTINGEKFEVIGFYEEVGNPYDDAQVYVTPDVMERLYPASKDKFGFIILQANEDVDPQELGDRVEDKLRKKRGQEEGKEDFFVQSFADAMETFSSIINIINGVLILIALISLLVGGIGIMNTMYTAVLERTKEIGVMKAIGAKRRDIVFVFVFESGLLGLIGGAIGILFGYGIASLGGAIAAAAGFALLKPAFPWYLILGCAMFAFLVGIVSGIMPAVRAAKQKPVESLRYE